jgi:glycyl-tRNA synthetase
MAEIEHYVDPLDKRHARFEEVKEVKLMLLPKEVQSAGRTELREMAVGDAVAQVSHSRSITTRAEMVSEENCR